MPDSKNKIYAPYGSDKVNIDSNNFASAKSYPKKRTMGTDKHTGKKTITITDNETKKTLFAGVDERPNGIKESSRFKTDSINYENQAKRQAEKINIGKVASKNALDNAKSFASR